MSPQQRAQIQARIAAAAEQRHTASVVETPRSVVETPAQKSRTADRHKDPKAHSAKVAARARARRAAAKGA